MFPVSYPLIILQLLSGRCNAKDRDEKGHQEFYGENCIVAPKQDFRGN